MELIETLISQLGISNEQAEGGAGLIMKTVKDKLGDADFGKLSDLAPGLNSLIEKAPEGGSEEGGGGGLLGKATSAFGGLLGSDDDSGGLGGLANLAGGFSSLGLDMSKIQGFISTILAFFKDKGGDSISGLLEKVLK